MSIEGIIGTETAGSVLRGSDRGESLVGGRENDIIEGRRGDDLLIGFEGADTIRGDDGDDTIFGDEGDDSLLGGADDDLIVGGDGNDTILGEDGDDMLRGLAGNDSILGGLGDDTVFYGGDDDPATGAIDENGFDTIDGGGGTGDVFDLSEYEWAVGLITDSVQERVRTDETDTFSGFPGGRDIANLTGFEGFVLTAFNDLAEANTDHEIWLGKGDDTLRIDAFGGPFGSGRFDGGAGFDRIEDRTGGTAGAVIDLSGATQTFTDALGQTHEISGFEIYAGSDNNDTITGSDADERFEDGAGADSIVAGAGDDTIVAHADGFAASETYDGGEGFDLIDYSAETGEITVDLFFEGAFGDLGSDTLLGFEDVIAGSGNDVIYGSVDGNRLDGGAGNDTLYGDEGDDALVGGAGDDLLDGDFVTNDGGIAGFDIADYTAATSALTIDLTLASGQVTGGADVGTDTLIGIEGIAGGLASDSFLGTTGDDVYFYAGLAGTGGHDTVTGNGGQDRLDFSNFGAAIGLDLSAVDAGIVTTRDGDTMLDTLGPERTAVTFTGIGTVVATSFGDDLKGSVGNDTLRGGEGNDRLWGRGGNNLLDGGAGIDTADYSGLTSSLGISVDISGEVFSALISGIKPGGFNGSGGLDVYEGIENVVGTDAGDFISGDGGANMLVGGDGADELWGRAGDDTLLGGQDNDRLEGMEGADLLDGGEGADTMIGGTGDDIYIVDDAGDIVTEAADGGIDTVIAHVSYTLSDHVEGLSLFGAATDNLAGTGNGGDNVIVGDDGANVLTGGAGNDDVSGGLGDDVFMDMDAADSDNIDRYDGGEGNDTVVYDSNLSSDVVIDLLNGVQTVSGDIRDTLISIENATVSGSAGIIGNAEANLLVASDSAASGNNMIIGGAGDDTLISGAGDDTLLGGAGADVLNGGDDIDTASYATSTSFVIVRLFDGLALGGDAAGDTLISIENLVGSDHDDSLIGAFDEGNMLDGGDGDDFLRGLSGDDTLKGGLGNDTIVGGAGADSMDGGAGDRDLLSYAGSDAGVVINLGNGFAQGGHATGDTHSGFEYFLGSDFNDAVFGGDGDNSLVGGQGNDNLVGDGGQDTLLGGFGDDTLRAGNVSAHIIAGEIYDGGDGADTFAVNGFSPQSDDYRDVTLISLETLEFEQSLADPAPGELRATFAADQFAAAGFTSIVGKPHDAFDFVTEIVMGAATNVDLSGVTVTGFTGPNDRIEITGDAEAEHVTGTQGVDQIIGGGGDDTLEGSAGADTINGGVGADVIDGGDDIDTASYAGSASRVIVRLWDGTALGGDAAGDTLISIENLIGSAHDDALIGGFDEANLLEGKEGNDILRGLSGDDTLIGGAGADVLDGGDGTDTANYETSGSRIIVRLFDSLALGGDAAGDTLTSIENLNGTDYNDALIGAFDQGNRLDGGGGNDLLRGLSGDDTLIGDDGDDTLDGGAGADELDGGEGIDTASYASSGSQVILRLWDGTALGGDAVGDTLTGIENLIGSAHDDALIGAFDQDNRLEGGAGADTLRGLSGDDTLLGGLGDDIFLGGEGADELDGGEGIDTASYASSGSRVILRLWDGTALGGDAVGDTLTGIENLIGSPHDDALIGAFDEANQLDGGDGNDLLRGLSGADTLIGGAGNDMLEGGGADGETDVFVFVPGDGADTVKDFADNEDLLEFGVGLTSLGDLSLTQQASDVLIDYGDGDSLLVEGISVAALSDDIVFAGAASADGASPVADGADQEPAPGQLLLGSAEDEILIGGDGSDTVMGDGGDDVLSGGARADLLFGGDGSDFINGGFGPDRLHGGAGADRFFHLGVAGHGSDWIEDYGASEGDVLVYGGGPARAQDFLVQFGNAESGLGGVDEAFVTHVPSGHLLWALVDGDAQTSINIQTNGEVFDLMA